MIAASSAVVSSSVRRWISSACPRATVIGVRSSCEASLDEPVLPLEQAEVGHRHPLGVLHPWRRRRACQTIARNIAAISGTSVSSSTPGWYPPATVQIAPPVATITTARTTAVVPLRQTRKPYSNVRLTQMKWNGTVSQSGIMVIAMRFATAKPPRDVDQSRQGQTERSRHEPIPDAAHGGDHLVAELAPGAADVDVHDVGPRIEWYPQTDERSRSFDTVSAGVAHQLPQEEELAVRERPRVRRRRPPAGEERSSVTVPPGARGGWIGPLRGAARGRAREAPRGRRASRRSPRRRARGS